MFQIILRSIKALESQSPHMIEYPITALTPALPEILAAMHFPGVMMNSTDFETDLRERLSRLEAEIPHLATKADLWKGLLVILLPMAAILYRLFFPT